MPKAFPPDTLNSVLSLLDSKKSHAEIIKKTKVSSAYISGVTAKYRPNLERSKGGRPRKLNPTATRYAARLVTNGGKINTREATQILSKIIGESINTRTVRRALNEAGLQSVKRVWKSKPTSPGTNRTRRGS